MRAIVDQVLAANADHAAAFGDKGELAMPPARRFAVLTCMDARLDPGKLAGLAEGDAIRSPVISRELLGTRECFVIRHTDCGMETSDDATTAALLASSLEPASP